MVSGELKEFNIILASASPRRRQLLHEAGIVFTPANVECEETWPMGLRGKEIAEYLAEHKSDSWSQELKGKDILITADTVVWCKEKFLGKPSGYDEAVEFLRLLSGCEHEVITGMCLRNLHGRKIFSVITKVIFRKLTEEEIAWYIDNYRPYDKAGAYGIQEWIGLRGITRIEGSYYNVVGMPVSELYDQLLGFIGRNHNK